MVSGEFSICAQIWAQAGRWSWMRMRVVKADNTAVPCAMSGGGVPGLGHHHAVLHAVAVLQHCVSCCEVSQHMGRARHVRLVHLMPQALPCCPPMMASLRAISSVFRLGRVTPGVSRMYTRGESHTCGSMAYASWLSSCARGTGTHTGAAPSHTALPLMPPPTHPHTWHLLPCPTWKPDICSVTPGSGPVRAVLW